MIPHVSNFIINMEGVLWHSNRPMTGLAAFLNLLVEDEQFNFLLETNNASRSAQAYVEKAASYDVTISPDRVLTAGAVTLQYLQDYYPPMTPMYLVGESGLEQLLKSAGYHILSEKEAQYTTAEVVVVGVDRFATYEKMAMAATHIKRGADFIATNADTNVPADGTVRPSTGALIAFIQTACGLPPRIIGKPNKLHFQEALRRLNCKPHEAVFVGDTLETDIAGAKEAGLHTILLLTGNTTSHQSRMSHIQADVILPDLRALTEEVRALQKYWERRR